MYIQYSLPESFRDTIFILHRHYTSPDISMGIDQNISHWQTIAFTVLCFSQMGHVLAIRSERESLFKIGPFSNKLLLAALILTIALQLTIIYTPFFNVVFKTQPLSVFELIVTLLISSIVFWAVEIEKWIIRLKKN